MVCNFFDKKTSGWTIKNKNISNKELAEELLKPFSREFNRKNWIKNLDFNMCNLLILMANIHGLLFL